MTSYSNHTGCFSFLFFFLRGSKVGSILLLMRRVGPASDGPSMVHWYSYLIRIQSESFHRVPRRGKPFRLGYPPISIIVFDISSTASTYVSYLRERMWRISIAQDPAEMDDPTKHFRHDTLNSPGLIRLIELLLRTRPHIIRYRVSREKVGNPKVPKVAPTPTPTLMSTVEIRQWILSRFINKYLQIQLSFKFGP